MEEQFTWTDLLEKYAQGTITPVEREALDRLKEASATKQGQFNALEDPDNFSIDLPAMAALETAAGWEKFITAYPQYDNSTPAPAPPPGFRSAPSATRMYLLAIGKGMAAAAIFYLMIWLVKRQYTKPEKPQEVTVVPGKVNKTLPKHPEHMPGIKPSKAAHKKPLPDTLPPVYFTTGANKMNLMECKDGIVALAGSMELWKQGYTLDVKYTDKMGAGLEQSISTIQTMKGQPVSIMLGDGTRVFLGPMSSLSFPAAFTDSQRVVELKGEAYFEVKSNPDKPFIVHTVDATSVEVTGTLLNINVRANKPQKVTLMKGKAAVRRFDRTVSLKPGEQAVVENNNTQIVKLENTMETIGYLKFDFSGWDIRNVLTYLGNWYGKPMVFNGRYSGAPSSGSFYRNEKLEDILTILKRFNEFNYIPKGDTLVITGNAKN